MGETSRGLERSIRLPCLPSLGTVATQGSATKAPSIVHDGLRSSFRQRRAVHIRCGRDEPMHGACMTCSAMCLSGLVTCMESTQAVRPTQPVQPRATTALIAGDLGTTTRSLPAPRLEASATQPVALTFLAFASPGPRRSRRRAGSAVTVAARGCWFWRSLRVGCSKMPTPLGAAVAMARTRPPADSASGNPEDAGMRGWLLLSRHSCTLAPLRSRGFNNA
jgi:hypothetical protein